LSPPYGKVRNGLWSKQTMRGLLFGGSRSKTETQAEAALLRLALWLDNEPRAVPKLNVATVYQALGFLDCLGVVWANKRLVTNEVSIFADNVGSIMGHVMRSLNQVRERHCSLPCGDGIKLEYCGGYCPSAAPDLRRLPSRSRQPMSRSRQPK
jgi:hypothetical protein